MLHLSSLATNLFACELLLPLQPDRFGLLDALLGRTPRCMQRGDDKNIMWFARLPVHITSFTFSW